MRAIRILALLLFSLPLYAQYGSQWNPGVTDLTSYLPTTNVWKALPTTTATGVTEGQDGQVFYLDSGGCVMPYNVATGTYGSLLNIGCSYHQITGGTAAYLGLTKANSCASGTYGFWLYNGTLNYQGCVQWVSLAADNTIFEIQSGNHGWLWVNSAWTDLGTGWTSGNVARSSAACGIKGGQVYVLDAGGTFNLLSHQPSNADAGLYGCVYEVDDNGQADSVYVWGVSLVGIQRYDINSAAWSNVVKMSTTSGGLATAGKGLLLGLDSSGHPYHLNVYGAYLSVTIQGSDVNGCGSGGCGGASHLISTQVQFPDSLSGGNETQKQYDPAANMSQSSMDFTATCDVLFGPSNDPKCTPKITLGTVFCSKLLSVIFSVGNAPPINTTKSVDGRGYDGSISYYGYTQLPGGSYGKGVCGITQNACAPKTAPSCPTTNTTHTVIGRCTGPNCTPAKVDAAILAFCESHNIGFHGAWRVQQQYSISQETGEKVCSGILYFFGGAGAFPVQCQ